MIKMKKRIMEKIFPSPSRPQTTQWLRLLFRFSLIMIIFDYYYVGFDDGDDTMMAMMMVIYYL